MHHVKKYIYTLLLPTFLLVLAASFQIIFSHNNIQADISKLDANQKKHFDLVLSKLPRTDLDNKPIEFLNKKVIIVNFWATWCVPCLKELPSLNDLYNKYSSNVLVLGINADYDEQVSKIKKFLDKKLIKFPNYHDIESKVADQFLVSSIPVTIIYVNGSVVEIIKGRKDFQSQEFKDTLDNWLAQ